MTAADYLPFSTRFIKGTGLLPSSNYLRKIFALVVFLPTTLLLNFMIIFNFGKANGDILFVAEAFESLSTYGQLTARKFIFILHGSLIEDILDDCNYQWAYDLFGPVMEKELRDKMALCIKVAKALCFCSIGTIVLMCVTAFFDDSKSVPLICWIPDFTWSTEIVFISEVIILFETLYYVVASDSFYLLVTMELQIQFNLMSKMVMSIQFGIENDANCLQKLTKCVQHHRQLMRLHKKLNRVFSEYFIMQYMITVTAVAIQGYLLLYRSLTFDGILKGVVYIFTVMFQVALYFIPASNITHAAENFSLQLYLAEWEATKSNKVNRHLLFMMMNSQEPLDMLGAGMLHVDRPQYLQILRLGFTIATILGGLK